MGRSWCDAAKDDAKAFATLVKWVGSWSGYSLDALARDGEDDFLTRLGAKASVREAHARVEEILEEVRVRLDAAGFDHLPSQQIVLTGGASQIPGLDGLASRILGQQVRLGRPLRVHGLPQAATGPGFAGAVGLSLFAAHPQDEWWDFEIPVDRYPARSLKRAVRWFRDNW